MIEFSFWGQTIFEVIESKEAYKYEIGKCPVAFGPR